MDLYSYMKIQPQLLKIAKGYFSVSVDLKNKKYQKNLFLLSQSIFILRQFYSICLYYTACTVACKEGECFDHCLILQLQKHIDSALCQQTPLNKLCLQSLSPAKEDTLLAAAHSDSLENGGFTTVLWAAGKKYRRFLTCH